ncbi:Lysine--tRNA ligase [Pseudobythopirellula maris]|uniref:Lysine--tRNA ligase n=1 Tax=Pseudobythopirellula maris TaxID=2527991 RepID=A0A5C5ZM51_9BACT|nr:lysine--tRNA ligase [Pseudobythopirellula maris]TWT88534.1 Lysine--tRNA ligase [Pseudobythopirellula maris]
MTPDATPPAADAAPSAPTTDPQAARRVKLEALTAMGVDPWGQRLDDHTPIGQVRARMSELRYRFPDGAEVELPDFSKQDDDFNFRQWKADRNEEHAAKTGEKGVRGDVAGPEFRVAGRIVLHRNKGKLHFIDLRDMTGDLQLMVGQKQVGDSWAVVEQLDLGDIIAVDGALTVTNTGELSIAATKVHFLCKSLETPPEKHHGLTDPEMRQRMRYVDLAYNDGVMPRFLDRTRIVRSVRDTLAERGFVEVEGPTLHSIAGGAAARPFNTHHNALDMPLFMRIALELHLKRLLVGGIERVYELGRVYRNEGISPKHNPEFTMLEVYQAYGNYESMMDLTEAVITDAIAATQQGSGVGGQGTGEVSYVLPYGEHTVDFTPPFERRTYNDLFAEHAGVDPDDEGAVADLAKKIGFDLKDESGAPRHPDVIKNEVFEAKVEDALVGPIFVIDYPASICPLTKRKKDNQAIAERFELFVRGMEIANAYTELNDPDLQEELFKSQLTGLSDEDSMAKMDDDFIRALRHGMPPTGGLGIGIDRLVMLLTNSQTIRDVILFPLLRNEK